MAVKKAAKKPKLEKTVKSLGTSLDKWDAVIKSWKQKVKVQQQRAEAAEALALDAENLLDLIKRENSGAAEDLSCENPAVLSVRELRRVLMGTQARVTALEVQVAVLERQLTVLERDLEAATAPKSALDINGDPPI